MQTLKANNKSYPIDYQVARKLTSSVRIKNGRVILRLSRFLRGRERDITIEKFLKWAEKRLEKANGAKDFVEPVYEDKGRVFTHNRIYEISVTFEDRKNAFATLKDDILIDLRFPRDLPKPKSKIAEYVRKVIIKDQTPYLKAVIEELNQLYFQEDYNECRFKNVKSRFGSCSAKGNINIAYRLLFAPREIFRYVCVHELAHLKRMDHSRKFWGLVENAMPDYKEHEKWLRENSFLLG